MGRARAHKHYLSTQKDVNKAIADVGNNIAAVLAGMGVSTEQALDIIAEEIKDRSLEIVPRDTETLAKSIRVESEKAGDTYTVGVGYMEDYAVFASTNANRGHDYKEPTTPNTHWNFLLAPVQEVEADIEKILADKLKEEFK